MVPRCRQNKIAVALSGGIDSSVVAYLLQKIPNTSVIALHMTNWSSRDEDNQPLGCVEQDMKDAEAVCQHLSIPLKKTSFESEYWTEVFTPYLDGISKGLTLNPDVACNVVVKFGVMKEYAMKHLGVDTIATGHYARLWNCLRDEPTEDVELVREEHMWIQQWISDDIPLLLKAVDATKDQSYFLSGVQGKDFRNVMFPLGDWIKSRTAISQKTVRELAMEAKLPNASKRESMGICFIGKRKFESFISQYLPPSQPGNCVDIDTGKIIGNHNGALLYTFGQGAKLRGAPHKYFVTGRDDKNTLYICQGTHHPALYSKQMKLDSIVWLGGSLPQPLNEGKRLSLTCRVRHLQPFFPCELELCDNSYIVYFHCPVRAVTPGQTAAFYLGSICLGGGIISERGPSYHDLKLELPTNIHPASQNDRSVDSW
jgi:tRNA U34 2-thiouridine synthase MnmA/TrmU